MAQDLLIWIQELGLDKYLPHTNNKLSPTWDKEALEVGAGKLDPVAAKKIQNAYDIDLTIQSMLEQDDGDNLVKALLTLTFFRNHPEEVGTGSHNATRLCEVFKDKATCNKYGILPEIGSCQWNQRWHLMSGSCDWVTSERTPATTNASKNDPSREVVDQSTRLSGTKLAIAGAVAATAVNPILAAAAALGTHLYGKKYGKKIKQWKAELQKQPESVVDTIWNLYTITTPQEAPRQDQPISLGVMQKGRAPERSGLLMSDSGMQKRVAQFMTKLHADLDANLRELGGEGIEPIEALKKVREQIQYVHKGRRQKRSKPKL